MADAWLRCAADLAGVVDRTLAANGVDSVTKAERARSAQQPAPSRSLFRRSSRETLAGKKRRAGSGEGVCGVVQMGALIGDRLCSFRVKFNHEQPEAPWAPLASGLPQTRWARRRCASAAGPRTWGNLQQPSALTQETEETSRLDFVTGSGSCRLLFAGLLPSRTRLEIRKMSTLRSPVSSSRTRPCRQAPTAPARLACAPSARSECLWRDEGGRRHALSCGGGGVPI